MIFFTFALRLERIGNHESCFTDSIPAWTNKEVLVAFGSAAAVLISSLIPALIALQRFLSASLRHRLAAANREIHELKLELASEEPIDPTSSHLKALLEDARVQAGQLSQEKLAAVGDLARQAEIGEEHRTAAEKLRGNLEAIQSQFASERKRVERALGAKGFTWTEKVRLHRPGVSASRRAPDADHFRPESEGRCRKDDTNRQSWAALSRRGWKVLMIDLDLQGSLTSLFMTEQDQLILEEKRQFIGDFLARSFDAEFPNMLNYTRPVMGSSGSALVGTVDTLAYAETNLTVRWLLREGNRDPRFILRRELHLRRISNSFDIVLLDCPPLINVCCVNALAASDSVLIPVMPSKAATDRVPVLLSRMLQFRENINGQLKVMGMVANRTFQAELTGDERSRLSELEEKAKNAWNENVPRLDTIIRQSIEVKRAEDEHRPLAEGEKMADRFDLLASEIEGRLPSFCQPTGTSNSLTARVTS